MHHYLQLTAETSAPKTESDFWDIVNQQAASNGNLNTDELDWGPAVGAEIIA